MNNTINEIKETLETLPLEKLEELVDLNPRDLVQELNKILNLDLTFEHSKAISNLIENTWIKKLQLEDQRAENELKKYKHVYTPAIPLQIREKRLELKEKELEIKGEQNKLLKQMIKNLEELTERLIRIEEKLVEKKLS